MFRIRKVLNHNTVIAISLKDNTECLIMGKGIGFGKKVAQKIQVSDAESIYELQKKTKRGKASDLARSIAPEYLELADIVLKEAEKKFETLDRSILFPMADHIEYAIKRLKNNEVIRNPLIDDIRILFHEEYKVAGCIVPIIKERMDIELEEDEIGYIALHVHSAIEKEEVSQAIQMAQAVRDCVKYVEDEIGFHINVYTLSYNRLMNHVRYMVARGLSKEVIKLNMNDYMQVRFPREFEMAKTVCDRLGEKLNCEFNDAEIGYLAMHLQRVIADETEKE